MTPPLFGKGVEGWFLLHYILPNTGKKSFWSKMLGSGDVGGDLQNVSHEPGTSHTFMLVNWPHVRPCCQRKKTRRHLKSKIRIIDELC